MNREIKFRAWEKRTRTMYYQGTFTFDLEFGFMSKDKQWMQYTGLKDKNGKEIYEGDILITESGKCQVVWNKPAACFRFLFYGENMESPLNYDDIEVIGNVWENPELLTP